MSKVGFTLGLDNRYNPPQPQAWIGNFHIFFRPEIELYKWGLGFEINRFEAAHWHVEVRIGPIKWSAGTVPSAWID